MAQLSPFQFIMLPILCLLVIVGLVGCNHSTKSSDDNPLPQYIEQYSHESKHVTMYSCRMLNRRTRNYYRGVGSTLQKAKETAIEECKTTSRFYGSCSEHIKFECGKRNQLVKK